jgi:type II secretory pathway pseudopilin PulG
MLIVVSILLIVTVAVAAVWPRFSEDRKMSRAADQIAQILLTVKQRALRDQIPTGVRLSPDPQQGPLITELQYIQQPDDFKGGAITVGPVVIPGVNGGLPIFAATGYNVDFTGGFGSQTTLYPVQAGDYLEVKGTGLVHLISAPPQLISSSPPQSLLVLASPTGFGNVTPGAGMPPILSTITLTDSTGTIPGNASQLAVGMLVNSPNWAAMPNAVQITGINNTTVPASITVQSSSALPAGVAALSFMPAPSTWIPAMTISTTGAGATQDYRIIRQPRVLTGETPLQLPAGICIDPTKSIGVPALPPMDIMFSPQGGVVNSAGNDRFILWVRDYTKDASAPGDQFLVLIQTHTGFIAEHPVNTGPGGYYLFTQDARSSGL